MGTVVEKVQYIDGTKQAIKEALRKKGVKVADTDTFRSYAEKIESIGGGGAVASAAEYVFMNTTQEVAFPREALTEKANNYFYNTASDKLTAMKAYLDNGNEVAYWGEYEDSWKVLQNSESWSGAPKTNTNIAFAFSEPVIPNFFHNRIGSAAWSLRATNDWDVFTTYLGGGASPEFMTTLIESGSNTNVTGGVDTAIGDGSTAYKYYVFKYMYSYADIYNISLKVHTGNVTCTLKSPNMTPSFKCYPDEYMQVITQDWYNGSEILPSQTLTFKPYEDGGCLVNYTDDGKAVNLKMFYAKSNGQIVLKHWAQPILDSNGTLGGESFAVYSDHEENSESAIYKAFDGNESTVWKSGSSSTPVNIIFYNPTPINVSNIHIKFINGEVYSSGDIYGSNDNNDYSLVGSFSNNSQDEIDVATNGNYKYFKIELTALYSGWGHIAEITITATEDGIKKDTYFISTDDITPPSGYKSVTKVADLNIPAHIYFNGTDWVMGE